MTTRCSSLGVQVRVLWGSYVGSFWGIPGDQRHGHREPLGGPICGPWGDPSGGLARLNTRGGYMGK